MVFSLSSWLSFRFVSGVASDGLAQFSLTVKKYDIKPLSDKFFSKRESALRLRDCFRCPLMFDQSPPLLQQDKDGVVIPKSHLPIGGTQPECRDSVV